MGFITTLTANNDMIHRLPEVEDLGVSIHHAILRLPIEDGPIEIAGTGMHVLESHHADYAMGVLVGGGKSAELIKDVCVEYIEEDPELVFLKRLAAKHGYSLRRKPKR